MNEEDLDNATMMSLNQTFVDTVRATGGNNANRLLLVEAQANNTDKALDSSFSAPNDSANMLAVSVHYYEPSTFCVAKLNSNWGHQETWGTASDITKMQNHLDSLQKKFIDNGIGVIIGEYGVDTSSAGGKDDASMKKFLKEVSNYALSKDGMCPVLWDMSVKTGTNGGEGDMYYFNRNTLEWYDPEIKEIFINNDGSVDTSGKTDRVTFSAADIQKIDEESGKPYFYVDLSPYKEFDVNLSSAVVKFSMTASGSTEASGDIACSFNVNGNDENLYYSNIDTAVGINDTSATIDLSGAEPFNVEWDKTGAVTKTVDGKIDMDYLKFENWWTWANNGDASVDFDSVTIIFDGYVTSDIADVTTTTKNVTTTTTATTTKTPVTTTTTVSTEEGQTTTTTEYVNFEGVLGNAFVAGQMGGYKHFKLADMTEEDGVVAAVDGDGQYEASWTITGDGTGSIEFLVLQIDPTEEFDNPFTTDAFPDLTLTVDKIYVDGKEIAFTQNDAAYNLRYYESGIASSRAYLRTNWGVNDGVDLGVEPETTVMSEIKVLFTVGGTNREGTSNVTPVDDKTVYGDANLDGKVTVADAVAILQHVALKDKYGLVDEALNNADVYSRGDGVTAMDALSIQKLDAGVIKSLPESVQAS